MRWLVLCLAISIGSSARGAIFDKDDRTTAAGNDAKIYDAIGVVNGGLLRSYATGFLIDQCHVLTAQHVLGDRKSAVGRRISFKAGIASGRPLQSQGTIILDGGYEAHERFNRKMSAPTYSRARAADWMVARLDDCLGEKLGYVRLVDSSLIPEPVKSAGFPMTEFGRGNLSVDPSCTIRGGSNLVLLNDCAALPGNSGSPLFREKSIDGRKILEVYAMQSAANDYRRRVYPFNLAYANVATPTSQILPRLSAVLARH